MYLHSWLCQQYLKRSLRGSVSRKAVLLQPPHSEPALLFESFARKMAPNSALRGNSSYSSGRLVHFLRVYEENWMLVNAGFCCVRCACVGFGRFPCCWCFSMVWLPPVCR